MSHTKVRNILHTGGELSIDLATHLKNCTQCQEYATTISVLETELPALWPEPSPNSAPINRVIDRVQTVVRERQPRWRALRFGQEMGWVGIAILLGLVVAWLSGVIEPDSILPLSGNSPSRENLPLADLSTPPPLPFTGFSEEVTIFEADLDCDGTVERLTGTALSPPGSYSNLLLLDMALEAYVNGETRQVFEIKSQDSNAPDLLQPQLILLSEESCEQLLAIPVFSNSNMYGDLKVYRWNGTTMDTVLEAPGWPVLDPVRPGTIITLQTIANNLTASQCLQTQSTYDWDGASFVLTSASQRSELFTCNNFLRTQPNGKIYQFTGDIKADRYTEIFAQTDLNCDGRFERLLVERPVQSSYEYVPPSIFRLALETGGQTVWEIFQPGNGTFSEPELFSPGGCENLLAVIEYQASDFGNLSVYQWNGETMQAIIEANGAPPSPRNRVSTLTQQPDRPFTITTAQIGLPETGVCHDLVTTYTWNGETFVQTNQVASSRVCEK
ncbi:MAG TPA: hypothetical protein VI451_12035 [Anaerolineales bacterium]|nr:hypothetical protein [Anaerolineales bacterium]